MSVIEYDDVLSISHFILRECQVSRSLWGGQGGGGGYIRPLKINAWWVFYELIAALSGLSELKSDLFQSHRKYIETLIRCSLKSAQ